jgi:hypothetical protein
MLRQLVCRSKFHTSGLSKNVYVASSSCSSSLLPLISFNSRFHPSTVRYYSSSTLICSSSGPDNRNSSFLSSFSPYQEGELSEEKQNLLRLERLMNPLEIAVQRKDISSFLKELQKLPPPSSLLFLKHSEITRPLIKMVDKLLPFVGRDDVVVLLSVLGSKFGFRLNKDSKQSLLTQTLLRSYFSYQPPELLSSSSSTSPSDSGSVSSNGNNISGYSESYIPLESLEKYLKG